MKIASQGRLYGLKHGLVHEGRRKVSGIDIGSTSTSSAKERQTFWDDIWKAGDPRCKDKRKTGSAHPGNVNHIRQGRKDGGIVVTAERTGMVEAGHFDS